MTSLKSRLEGKPRHRVTYLVQVADTTDAEAALDVARRAVALLELTGAQNDESRDDDLTQARAEQQDATAALSACYEPVVFVALSNLDMERIESAHQDAKGELDRSTIGPVLAAACAEDEDLQDAEWWRAQLAGEQWSMGDKDSLVTTLLTLNWHTPPASLPKG